MEVKEASASYLRQKGSSSPPGYKQTEVGVIPEDWEVKPLSDVFSFSGGLSASRAQLGDSGHCYLHYGDIHTSSKSYVDVDIQHVELPKLDVRLSDVSRKSILSDGDVVFVDASEDDEGTSKHQVILNPQNIPFISGLHTIVAKSKSNDLENGYKCHCFHTRSIKKQFLFYSVGTKVSGISKTNIGKILLPIPPVTEQEAIAEALSDADVLIESLDQLLAKKRHLKQGVMQELLIGKKRLPGFSGEWEVRRLGTTATLKARIGWQGLTTAEYLDSGDYYLVTGTEFKEGYIDWNNCHYVDESRYKQDKNIQLKEHDVLVTKDGTIGKVALITNLPRPATLNSGVFVIRSIEDAFHPEFFYYLLCSNVFNEFLVQLSAGSTINHLYQKDFVNFIYRTPPTIDEQTAIAAILSDMDTEIAALEAKLAKARSIKQGMMQELLTGRIRLVRPSSNVVQMPVKKEAGLTSTKSHNWQINEAVVISVLAKHFGSEQWPFGRKRYTKLSYLLHRQVERQVGGYLKKAAGPYNPETKYKGPEGIALKNRYVRFHSRDKFSGFVAAEKIGEAESYFSKWYGEDVLAWLEQFRRKSNDELELLATVDMAMNDLRRRGKAAELATVKKVIQGHPEWEAKLDRAIFSDDNIRRAIESCRQLFAFEETDG